MNQWLEYNGYSQKNRVYLIRFDSSWSYHNHPGLYAASGESIRRGDWFSRTSAEGVNRTWKISRFVTDTLKVMVWGSGNWSNQRSQLFPLAIGAEYGYCWGETARLDIGWSNCFCIAFIWAVTVSTPGPVSKHWTADPESDARVRELEINSEK